MDSELGAALQHSLRANAGPGKPPGPAQSGAGGQASVQHTPGSDAYSPWTYPQTATSAGARPGKRHVICTLQRSRTAMKLAAEDTRELLDDLTSVLLALGLLRDRTPLSTGQVGLVDRALGSARDLERLVVEGIASQQQMGGEGQPVVGLPPHRQRDRAVVGELAGVREQVEEGLPDLGQVGVHRAEVIGAGNDQRVGEAAASSLERADSCDRLHRPLSYDPGFSSWSATMADAAAHWTTMISAMASAFLAGDNAAGEELLLTALDLGAPWDVVTATAARARAGHRARESAPDTPDGLLNSP